jgi:hypothetical protein
VNNRTVQATGWAVFGWTLLIALAAEAQDTLEIRNADGGITVRSGTVIDINDERVLFRFGDREQTIPFSQVETMRTALDPLAEAGDQLYGERQYELAFEAYGKSLGEALPAWMRRRLLAGRVRAAVQMGGWNRAVDDFMVLVSSDPRTEQFAVIPLAWLPSPPDPALLQKIPQWLSSNHKLLQLIGASHALTGNHRSEALQTLNGLAKDEDRRIGSLAQAQLWRTVPQPDRATLEQWKAELGKMPAALRAGPYYVWGSAAVQADPEQAVLHLLHLPILHADRFDLSARALLQSADVLIRLGRATEARTLLQEVVDRHGRTAESDLAAEKIRQLSATREVPLQ